MQQYPLPGNLAPRVRKYSYPKMHYLPAAHRGVALLFPFQRPGDADWLARSGKASYLFTIMRLLYMLFPSPSYEDATYNKIRPLSHQGHGDSNLADNTQQLVSIRETKALSLQKHHRQSRHAPLHNFARVLHGTQPLLSLPARLLPPPV